MSDSDGYKRGAKGIDGRKGEDFTKPDFDRRRQQAERAVGMYATADKPGVVDSAVLEGDDA